MDLNTTGSPVMIVVALFLVLVTAGFADRDHKGMAAFFGLLSIVLTLLFCTAQILKKMP